jgi:HK97 gp10 family phage protein
MAGITPKFTRPSRSPSANFQPINGLFEIQFKRILIEVSTASERAVTKTSQLAMRTAQAKVPVRKAFKGGRETRRTLSIAELRAEMPAFRAQLPAKMARRLSTTDVPIFRIGTQVVTHPNQANRWRNTQDARVITRDSKGDWKLGERTGAYDEVGNEIVEPRIPSEEQYLLRQMRGAYTESAGGGKLKLKLRKGDIFTDPTTGVSFVGGNLKHSLMNRADQDILVRHKRSIVAGGPRAPYAKYMEFGSRHAPAQPFLRPAMKSAEVRFGKIMRQELAKIGTEG